MRKRIILVGGLYDTADNPMSVGISVRDYIGNGEPPAQLSYPESGEKKDVYNYDAMLNTPAPGKTWKDNDVYIYVYQDMQPHEIIQRLVKHYGKYEALVIDLERRVRHEIETSSIDA